MIRIAALALALGVLAVGCGSERQTGDQSRESLAAPAARPEECGKSDSATDLSKEQPYSANYLHRWTNAEGCEVRLDIIMTRRGPDSCGGSKVADILLGWPLGSSHAEHRPYRIFVRDPENVLGDSEIADAFDDGAELPAEAVDTGYRQEGAELWMQPGDDAYVYLVYADRVERWPHDGRPAGCF
jgi:hypothetical protein